MSDQVRARWLGRQMSLFLIDQSIFAWTHRILGIISGLFCGFAWISTHALSKPLGAAHWLGRGYNWITAAIFFCAAFPFVVSYWSNREWVNQSIVRTIAFAALLLSVAAIADGIVVTLFRNNFSYYWLLYLSVIQASVYSKLGERILGVDKRIYRSTDGY